MTGPNEDDVFATQLDALRFRGLLAVVRGDPVALWQTVDPVETGDVEEDPTRDDRRVVLGAALVPDATAEVLVRRPAVPERPVEAEVVERVDVRPAVRVHVDRVAAVAVLLVHLRRKPGEAVVDRPLRRVRHPDLVLRVSGGEP